MNLDFIILYKLLAAQMAVHGWTLICHNILVWQSLQKHSPYLQGYVFEYGSQNIIH